MQVTDDPARAESWHIHPLLSCESQLNMTPTTAWRSRAMNQNRDRTKREVQGDTMKDMGLFFTDPRSLLSLSTTEGDRLVLAVEGCIVEVITTTGGSEFTKDLSGCGQPRSLIQLPRQVKLIRPRWMWMRALSHAWNVSHLVDLILELLIRLLGF